MPTERNRGESGRPRVSCTVRYRLDLVTADCDQDSGLGGEAWTCERSVPQDCTRHATSRQLEQRIHLRHGTHLDAINPVSRRAVPCAIYPHSCRPGASIPIYQWRQMRHGQFFFLGGGSIKSLILSFNIQQYEFCAQI